jgi:hypothetical protein
MSDVYISTDIEADGPIPGPHSMLSFASIAYADSGKEIGSFWANLQTLPGAVGDPKTMDWWRRNPEAYAETRRDLQDPEEVMRRYVNWLAQFSDRPVFVGYPVTFDFMFVYWYLMRFVGSSPFSHSGWDIKTAAAIAMRTPFRKTGKRNMPKAWFGPQKHSHRAPDDAREQGELHFNILRALGRLPEKS